MQTQKLESRTPYYTAPKGDHRRPRYPSSSLRPSTSPGQTPEFDDNLVGFSLAPAWLQFVHDISNRQACAEYPFPRSLESSPASSTGTTSSQWNSPLNTPLATQSQPFKSEISLSSELEDRLYWEEETSPWSDEEEQEEDLEGVYNSIKY